MNWVNRYCWSLSEKAMATHSSTLAWKIPWTEEAGRLQSMGSLRSRTWLSDFTFTFHFNALEKEMATHSSVLAWRIPGTEEPGGLPSRGSHRVGHDWSNLVAAAAAQLSLPCSQNSFPEKSLSLNYSHCVQVDHCWLPGYELCSFNAKTIAAAPPLLVTREPTSLDVRVTGHSTVLGVIIIATLQKCSSHLEHPRHLSQ